MKYDKSHTIAAAHRTQKTNKVITAKGLARTVRCSQALSVIGPYPYHLLGHFSFLKTIYFFPYNLIFLSYYLLGHISFLITLYFFPITYYDIFLSLNPYISFISLVSLYYFPWNHIFISIKPYITFFKTIFLFL